MAGFGLSTWRVTAAVIALALLSVTCGVSTGPGESGAENTGTTIAYAVNPPKQTSPLTSPCSTSGLAASLD